MCASPQEAEMTCDCADARAADTGDTHECYDQAGRISGNAHTCICTEEVCSEELCTTSGGVWTNLCASCTCPAIDCAGSWSRCTSACETAAERTWNQTAARLGAGDPCPDATDCAWGDGDCFSSPPPSGGSSRGSTAVRATALSAVVLLMTYLIMQ